MNNPHHTRESWLNHILSRLAPTFENYGAPLPDKLHVTCGWPLSGGRPSRKGTTIGQCFAPTLSADQRHEIFISPSIADSVHVAATLAHEAAHAAVGVKHGHRGPFVKLIRNLDLIGPPTATNAGDDFTAMILPIIDAIGPYPHAIIDLSQLPKQTTRLIKVFCRFCESDGQPYIIRMSRKPLSNQGAPICPEHNEQMVIEWPDEFDTPDDV